jgi:hypothetical protein
MQSMLKDRKTLTLSLALCLTVVILSSRLANATENGATAFPVGVETVMTGMYPHPGQTMFYEYTAFYEANEIDNSQGKSAAPEFKLRVFATAIKINHTWDLKLLGGHFNTNIAIPVLYEQLHVVPGKFEKYAIQNVDWVPLGVVYSKGIAHWYYEVDIFTPGTAYSENDVLNIGTHYFSAGPVGGFTLLPNKGKTEISSRTTYLFNGPDKDTHYHSGNEYFSEFNVDQSVTKKMALGLNGAIYQQTTDDKQNDAVFQNGYRGRDLQIGPQARFTLGHHGGFAFKYYRDTLVQNRPRGNSFWFQIAVPFPGLSKGSEGH